jgi:hypothetical protein
MESMKGFKKEQTSSPSGSLLSHTELLRDSANKRNEKPTVTAVAEELHQFRPDPVQGQG